MQSEKTIQFLEASRLTVPTEKKLESTFIDLLPSSPVPPEVEGKKDDKIISLHTFFRQIGRQWFNGLKIRPEDKKKLIRYDGEDNQFTFKEHCQWAEEVFNKTVIRKINNEIGVGLFVAEGQVLAKGVFIPASGVIDFSLLQLENSHCSPYYYNSKKALIDPSQFGNPFDFSNHAFDKQDLHELMEFDPKLEEKVAAPNLRFCYKSYNGYRIQGVEVIQNIQGGQQLLWSYANVGDYFNDQNRLKKPLLLFNTNGRVIDPIYYRLKMFCLCIAPSDEEEAGLPFVENPIWAFKQWQSEGREDIWKMQCFYKGQWIIYRISMKLILGELKEQPEQRWMKFIANAGPCSPDTPNVYDVKLFGKTTVQRSIANSLNFKLPNKYANWSYAVTVFSYHAVLAIDKQNSEGVKSLALIYEYLKSYQQLEIANLTLRLRWDTHWVLYMEISNYLNLVSILPLPKNDRERTQQYQTTIDENKQIISIYEEHPKSFTSIDLGIIYYRLACAQFNLGQFYAAQKNLKEAIKCDSNPIYQDKLVIYKQLEERRNIYRSELLLMNQSSYSRKKKSSIRTEFKSLGLGL